LIDRSKREGRKEGIGRADPSDNTRPEDKTQTEQQDRTPTPPAPRLRLCLFIDERRGLGYGDLEGADSGGSLPAVVPDLDEEDDVADGLYIRPSIIRRREGVYR
jgi:hypothetical protein